MPRAVDLPASLARNYVDQGHAVATPLSLSGVTKHHESQESISCLVPTAPAQVCAVLRRRRGCGPIRCNRLACSVFVFAEIYAARFRNCANATAQKGRWMYDLATIAPAFVSLAHSIASCSAATVDVLGRPRSSILRPLWEWDGESLIGWVATTATSTQVTNLKLNPYISFSYWSAEQDSCVAECRACWVDDPLSRQRVWDMLERSPRPLGFDPTIIPAWTSPSAPAFHVLRAVPWKLWVFPGATRQGAQSRSMAWSEPSATSHAAEFGSVSDGASNRVL